MAIRDERATDPSDAGFERTRELLALARAKGLLGGRKTVTIRGRMDAALIEAARQRTGIHSDTALLEAALARLALEDDFADWLIAQKGSVDPDLDLGI